MRLGYRLPCSLSNKNIVPLKGFEPSTPSTGNWCSNPLSYRGNLTMVSDKHWIKGQAPAKAC